jgi:lipopolysaccharide export system permease protein
MNDYFLPAGTINFGKLYRKLLSSTPALELKSYSVKNYRDSTIVTGEVSGSQINDILILDLTNDGKKRVIVAKHAILSENDQRAGIIAFDLSNVMIHMTDPAKPDRFEYSTADRMVYTILLKNIIDSVGSIGPREMRSSDVKKIIVEKQHILDEKIRDLNRTKTNQISVLAARYALISSVSAAASADNAGRLLNDEYQALMSTKHEDTTDRSLQVYKLEYYKKFSIPFASIFFVFFAFPVGLFSRRNGRSVGFGIGILVAVLYWILLIGGQTIGTRTEYSPMLSMWLPDFFVLLLGFVALGVRRIR